MTKFVAELESGYEQLPTANSNDDEHDDASHAEVDLFNVNITKIETHSAEDAEFFYLKIIN